MFVVIYIAACAALGIEAEMRKRLSLRSGDNGATNCSGKPDPASRGSAQKNILFVFVLFVVCVVELRIAVERKQANKRKLNR
jgi:hypothetical protein